MYVLETRIQRPTACTTSEKKDLGEFENNSTNNGTVTTKTMISTTTNTKKKKLSVIPLEVGLGSFMTMMKMMITMLMMVVVGINVMALLTLMMPSSSSWSSSSSSSRNIFLTVVVVDAFSLEDPKNFRRSDNNNNNNSHNNNGNGNDMSKTIQQQQQQIPGIWKLTTSSLPYEPDIRSQLQGLLLSSSSSSSSSSSASPGGNTNYDDAGDTDDGDGDDGDGDTVNDNDDVILLKLNQDGTFKQCDEGYTEGKWISGCWKLSTDTFDFLISDVHVHVDVDAVEERGGEEEEGGEEDGDTQMVVEENEEKDDAVDDEADLEDKNIKGRGNSNASLRLVLAMNRQYYGPQFDILLVGTPVVVVAAKPNSNKNDNNNSNASRDSHPSSTTTYIYKGTIRKGKYLHPQRHPSFFDAPMLANPESLGPFTLEQSIAVNSIITSSDSDTISDGIIQNSNSNNDSGMKSTDNENMFSDNKISASDLYGKEFILTFEPLDEPAASKKQRRRRQYQNQNQRSRNNSNESDNIDVDQRLVDIRSMPVTFYTNNTFTAHGNKKILRGRFQVISKEEIVSSENVNESISDTIRKDPTESSGDVSSKIRYRFTLSMEVSLFGAGRSAPGSVYSEGIGLTHDDEQSYVGEIQWEQHIPRNRRSKDRRKSHQEEQEQQSDQQSDQQQKPDRQEQHLNPNRQRRLFAYGTVFFGTDLGEDARPEPSGKFTLIQDSNNSDMTISNKESNTRHSNDASDENNDDDRTHSSYSGGVFE